MLKKNKKKIIKKNRKENLIKKYNKIIEQENKKKNKKENIIIKKNNKILLEKKINIYLNNLNNNFENKEEFINSRNYDYKNNIQKNKKILFFAGCDYANILTEWSYAINKYSNYSSRILVLKNHQFNYEIKPDYVYSKNKNDIKDVSKWIDECENIIVGNNILEPKKTFSILFKEKKLTNKKFSIFYYGSYYRKNYLTLNKAIYDKYIYAPDLFRLSDKEHKYYFYPISNIIYEKQYNIEDLINEKFKDKIMISHLPSNKNKKNSNLIIEIINNLLKDNKYSHFNFFILKEKKQHSEIINIMKNTTLYIDQLVPDIGGYGLSSMEAVSLGCISFCSMNKLDDIGNIPIINILPDNFKEKIKYFLDMPINEIKEYIRKNYNIFINKYNPKYFSNEFIKKII